MKLSGYINWFRTGQVMTFLRLSKSSRELYRMCFLARASQIGLFRMLASRPKSLEELSEVLGIEDGSRTAFSAFVEMGVSLGELSRTGERYQLRSTLAKSLARPDSDALCALAEEIAGVHVPYILGAPGENGTRKRFAAITDEFSTVVARSSRVLEPILNEVTDSLIPADGPLSLLEVGCGSGVYLLRALRRNPQLKAIGVEVQAEVADRARSEIAAAGFSGRLDIMTADVRSLEYHSAFDLITLHNNIYYFPESERKTLLSRLLAWLKQGGKLVISSTTNERGLLSSVGTLWTEMTEGAGPLPNPTRFCSLLQEIGFTKVRCHRPVPTQSYAVFTAEKR